jgi:chemotaxis protein methyltransferase CheR
MAGPVSLGLEARSEVSRAVEKDKPVALLPADFDFVRTLVRQRAAIVLEDEKAYLVEARLLPLARREAGGSLSELITRIRANAHDELRHKVVEAMTTNETSFFRDVNPFEALRKIVLPELIQKRATVRRLYLWCAASSSGQEPYTLAMVLREHFAALPGWQLQIHATDLSQEMIGRCREGIYNQIEVNRGLPAALLVKYFQRHGDSWRINDEIRRMVEFRTLNLIEPWPAMPAWDVVFVRNVLIYFDVAIKSQILDKVRQSLRSDGFLFLGGAESPINLSAAFERVNYERAGCYRLRS